MAEAKTVSTDDPADSKCIVKRGNLFDVPLPYAYVHCVSRDLKMGAGIALQFRTRYGRVDELAKQCKTIGQSAYMSEEKTGRHLFYMITKERYWDKPTYSNLEHVIIDVREQCKSKGITHIAMPQIGCGLDRLSWSKVQVMIKHILTDFHVMICYL